MQELSANEKPKGNSPKDEKAFFNLSQVHTLVKIGISFVASLVTVVLSSPQGLTALFVCSLGYALFLPRLRFLLYAYLAAGFMFCIANFFSYIMSLFIPIPFNVSGILVPFLRMIIMLNVILPLALSTNIQSILTSLKSLHLPFFIYLPAAVMIRFIPTFIHDVKQVSETLKIRGYTMSVGETMRHPFTMMRLLFTPLLFRSLRTSEDLGIAGELKGLNPRSVITQYKKESWKKNDFILITFAGLAFVLAIIIEVYFGVEITGGHR